MLTWNSLLPVLMAGWLLDFKKLNSCLSAGCTSVWNCLWSNYLLLLDDWLLIIFLFWEHVHVYSLGGKYWMWVVTCFCSTWNSTLHLPITPFIHWEIFIVILSTLRESFSFMVTIYLLYSSIYIHVHMKTITDPGRDCREGIFSIFRIDLFAGCWLAWSIANCL